jgi:hypothetical protein
MQIVKCERTFPIVPTFCILQFVLQFAIPILKRVWSVRLSIPITIGTGESPRPRIPLSLTFAIDRSHPGPTGNRQLGEGLVVSSEWS